MSTTTLASPTEAMTAAELARHKTIIRSAMGPNAWVGMNISDAPNFASLSLYPNGITSDETRHHLSAPSWPEAIEAARQWIANYKVTSRDATIRKMALAIIELTDEHGKCTDAMLTRQKFSADQVAEFHEASCQRANEMCQGSPFAVEFVL